MGHILCFIYHWLPEATTDPSLQLPASDLRRNLTVHHTPYSEGLEACWEAMEKPREYQSSPIADLCQLIETILMQNSFSFNNNHYLQLQGIFMGRLEHTLLTTSPQQPHNWWRFIDWCSGPMEKPNYGHSSTIWTAPIAPSNSPQSGPPTSPPSSTPGPKKATHVQICQLKGGVKVYGAGSDQRKIKRRTKALLSLWWQIGTSLKKAELGLTSCTSKLIPTNTSSTTAATLTIQKPQSLTARPGAIPSPSPTGPSGQAELTPTARAPLKTLLVVDPGARLVPCWYTFTSNSTGTSHKISCHATWRTSNLIYLTSCKRRGSQYTKETEQSLRDHINSHRSNKCIEKSVPTHFCANSHNVGDIRVMVVGRLGTNDAILRKIREGRWMTTLDTTHPRGLNLRSDCL